MMKGVVMKELDTVLKLISEGLKSMSQGINALAHMVDDLSKSKPPKEAKAPKRSKAKAPKAPVKTASEKAKPATATESVLNIVMKSKGGVDTKAIVNKTGFAPRKVSGILYRLKAAGKIKNVKKGKYIKV
jgi:uncharacterized membrane protein